MFYKFLRSKMNRLVINFLMLEEVNFTHGCFSNAKQPFSKTFKALIHSLLLKLSHLQFSYVKKILIYDR